MSLRRFPPEVHHSCLHYPTTIPSLPFPLPYTYLLTTNPLATYLSSLSHPTLSLPTPSHSLRLPLPIVSLPYLLLPPPNPIPYMVKIAFLILRPPWPTGLSSHRQLLGVYFVLSTFSDSLLFVFNQLHINKK